MLDYTESVCPKCRRVIPARIYFKNKNTMIESKCPEHGKFKTLHMWDTKELYNLTCNRKEKIRCEFPLYSVIRCEDCNSHIISNQLVLFTTPKCNLNCKFCYDGLKKHIDHFYLKDIENIVSSHPNLRGIQLSGGEVTLRKDLFEIISFLKKKGLKISIITNGTRTCDIDYVKKLKKSGVDSIIISVEEGLRSKKILTCAYRSIDNFKRYGINFGVSFTVTKKNINQIKKITEFAISNGASGIRIAPHHTTKFNKREIGYVRFSDVIKAFCEGFDIKMQDLKLQHKFRYMAEGITSYLSSGIWANNFCSIQFWFIRKNNKIKKYNETSEFKLLYMLLRLFSNSVILKIIKSVNYFFHFKEKISFKNFYRKNLFLVELQHVMNTHNIDLRFLQDSKGIVILKKADIKKPIPYCYSHMIRGFA
jgi:molybdenum cofactor biosynthesis enzyme MoaA